MIKEILIKFYQNQNTKFNNKLFLGMLIQRLLDKETQVLLLEKDRKARERIKCLSQFPEGHQYRSHRFKNNL
jgi:hypothetical protein